MICYLAWRVLREIKETNHELKKLIALLITPVNLMFEDAKRGDIKLTPQGEALKELVEKE